MKKFEKFSMWLKLCATLLLLRTVDVQAQSCTPAPANLVSWWRAEGDATDAVGANNGSANGVNYLIGETGQAFSFDGSTTYIDLGNPASLQLQNFTIEAWIQRYSSSSISLIAPNGEILCYGSGGYGLGMWSDGRVYLTRAEFDNISVYAGLTDTNSFHHVAVTKSGTSVIIYVDGVSYPASSAYTSTFTFTTPIAIGADGDNHTAPFYGAIDELAVYSRALSAAEIKALYQAGAGGKCLTGGPVITLQPVDSSFDVASNGTFTVAASGTLPLSYQWSFNGTNLPWATNYSLTLTNVQPLNAGQYSVVVSNLSGSVTSYAANLTVVTLPPSISTQPASQTTYSSRSASFSVTVSGTPPFSYQWLFNSNSLSGATSPILTLSNLQTNQSGVYAVVVSNSAGTVTSSNAILNVFPLPQCVTAPSNLVSWWQGEGNAWDAYGGINGTASNVTYAAAKVGQGFILNGSNAFVNLGNPLSLQLQNFTIEAWIRRFSSTSTSLINQNGEILCYGSGGYGLGIWNTGNLYLTKADSDNVQVGTGLTDTNGFHHVAVSKLGTNVSFYLDGVYYPAPSSYNSTFTFTAPVAIGCDADTHYAAFYGAIDEVSVYSRALSSNEIQGIYNAGVVGKCPIMISPAIVQQPTNLTTVPSNNVSLGANVVGSPLLNFQWLLNGAAVPGATNSSLTFSNIQPSSAGIYSLLVTNTFGSVTSFPASVKVVLVTVLGNGLTLTNSTNSFSTSVSIQLRNFYSGGYIFYTLDGSIPTPFSAVYSGPLVLSNNAVIRTLAFSVDFLQYAYSDPLTVQIVPSYTLTKSTAGGGTISANPASTSNSYLSGTLVTLTATPSTGWTFLGWAGDLGGTNATNSLVMTGNKSVQAVFGTTVTNSAGGGGSVVFDPPGTVFPYGFNLQASAVPQAGNVFVLWGNAAVGNTNPLSFTVTNPNPEISALFTTVSSGDVALTVVPVGRGRVSVSPRANEYSSGTAVTITATPDAGKSFLGWSGNAAGSQNPMSVVMNQSKVIYANFGTNNSLVLTLVSGLQNSQGVELDLNGEIGTHYRLDGTTDLVNWTPLFNLTNDVGTLHYIDYSASNQNKKFYRSVILP
jgi:hypothetical protein